MGLKLLCDKGTLKPRRVTFTRIYIFQSDFDSVAMTISTPHMTPRSLSQVRSSIIFKPISLKREGETRLKQFYNKSKVEKLEQLH